MKLLAFSPRESFDSQNPWTRLLARGGRSGHAITLTGFAGALLLGILWAAGMFEQPVIIQTVSTVAYVVLITGAFMAPALGAASRRKLDTSSFLPGALQTPMTSRTYLAPLHGAVLKHAFITSAYCLVTIPFVIWTLHSAGIWHVAAMRSSAFHLYLEPLGFWGMARLHDPMILAGGAIAGTAALGNYFAGVYLRATALASVCQIAPSTTLRGGLLTSGLIGAAMVTCLIRAYLTGAASIGSTGRVTLNSAILALAVFTLLEAASSVIRIALARFIWDRMEKTAIDESSKWLTAE